MRILVIEDESELRAQLRDRLSANGWIVVTAADGEEGYYQASEQKFDVAVIDLGLPGISGMDVIRRIRADGRSLPILILTARNRWQDKVDGLEAGADDYLVKPFALQELEARLAVLLRRGRGNTARVLNVADLEFNLDTLEVFRGGTLVTLNPTALKILQVLMEASPAVVTRQELETRVWGEELPDSDSLRVHIHGLRAAVDKPFGKPLIQTRHGIGYRLADLEAAA